MRPRVITGTGRRRPGLLAACLAAVAILAACGLPGDGNARAVEGADVPYDLLDPAGTPGGQPDPSDTDGPGSSPGVFWIQDDGLLGREAVESTCAEVPRVAVEDLLLALGAGPSDEARSSGLSTAIPPESGLTLVEIDDGTATVEIVPASEISADRLPAAVGQIVLTVTSARGVQAVQLVDGDDALPVPIPGGALTAEPVTAEDYSPLLPARPRPAATGCPER